MYEELRPGLIKAVMEAKIPSDLEHYMKMINADSAIVYQVLYTEQADINEDINSQMSWFYQEFAPLVKQRYYELSIKSEKAKTNYI